VPGRSGGRDNGLHAAQYAALADLDPRLADAMLDALRDRGVAAYTTPVSGTTGPYLDVQLPDRPLDRLWVDATATEPARMVLRSALPELLGAAGTPASATATDEDAVWRAIVAGYGDTAVDPGLIEPAQRGASPPQAQPAEDHYLPPPPPALPRTDAVTKLAWAGVIGGPAYLLIATALEGGAAQQLAVLAVLAFIGGFVTLVARMKERPPTDSGSDDGAVV
jgi:hypothetical protein